MKKDGGIVPEKNKEHKINEKTETEKKYEIEKNNETNKIEETKESNGLKNFDETEKFEEIEIYEISELIKNNKNKRDNSKSCYKVIVKKTLSDIIDIKLNPKYHTIFMVVTEENILFYVIDTEINIISKPRFIFNKEKYNFLSAIFNPSKSHIITCSCKGYDTNILIWSIGKPSIKKIICKNTPSYIKWEKKGYLLGFIDEFYLMKIYSILHNKEIFHLDFEEKISDFNFFKLDNILICNKGKDKIYQCKFDFNSEENLKKYNKSQCVYIYCEKHKFFYVSDCYIVIYLNDQKRIKLFDDDLNNQNLINEFECQLNDPKIIKNSEESVVLEILDIDENNTIKLKFLNYSDKGNNKKDEIVEKDKKNLENKGGGEDNSYKTQYDSFEDSSDDLVKECKDYFDENCPEKFCDIKECLNFENNIYEDEPKKNKLYFKIEEIIKILEREVEKENLIQRRKYVKEEIKKTKKFGSIKEEYMFYLKLLIRDETNVDLLKNYLLFLQKGENEEYLEKEKILHEKFYDELIYYSVFFEKEEIKKIFGYDLKSEEYVLLDLLQSYSNAIKDNNLEGLKNTIEKNYIKRHFNQPFSNEQKELICYNFYKEICFDIFNKKKIEEKELKNKLNIINKILDNKIIEKIGTADTLIPLSRFIYNSEDEKTANFFINMINSKTFNDKELEEKRKTFNFKIEDDQDIVYNKEYYQHAKELCFENLNDDNYKKCEKYNFDYLIKNPPLNLYINEIKAHLKLVLKSNVFNDAFKLLFGTDDYKRIYDDDMISEFVDNIKFLPINSSYESAFIDKLTLATFVPTMKKIINLDLSKDDKKITIALENGIIIAIIYHEFGHETNAVISFSENKLKNTETPRKKYLDFKEGGYYLELALFGRIIKKLSYGEVLYILNENNYNKSLEDFKKGFMQLSDQDLKINGLFADLYVNNEKKINEYRTSLYIKAKNEDKSDVNYKDITISIPLRNDVHGREIKEKDLMPYF